MPFLPNGQEVVLPYIGHTGSFFDEQPDAGTHLINTFFDTGAVDASLYQPQPVDFTPSTTFSGTAKIIVGAMLGLAALAVLSLTVLARRVHTKGRIGPRVGAVLRSVHPVVLGLGGWSLGALVVLTTMPGVRITNELLVVVSVGVPIGLGIYWAWAHGDWSAATKTAGFAATAGGALVGGWLGSNATDGLLSLLTAIVGAAVGSNLFLIILDISRRGEPTAATSHARQRRVITIARSHTTG